MKHFHKFIALVLLIAAAAVIAACGGSDLSTEDAHDTKTRCRGQASTACVDDSQKRAIAFPNHYANVATSCDGYGHRIYVTTRDFITIIADPSCGGYSSKTPQMGVLNIQR
jgi:hypothetical protein